MVRLDESITKSISVKLFIKLVLQTTESSQLREFFESKNSFKSMIYTNEKDVDATKS